MATYYEYLLSYKYLISFKTSTFIDLSNIAAYTEVDSLYICRKMQQEQDESRDLLGRKSFVIFSACFIINIYYTIALAISELELLKHCSSFTG